MNNGKQNSGNIVEKAITKNIIKKTKVISTSDTVSPPKKPPKKE